MFYPWDSVLHSLTGHAIKTDPSTSCSLRRQCQVYKRHIRQSDGSYKSYCEAVSSKASTLTGTIRRSLQIKSPQQLWPAFQSYVLPSLMYDSVAWSPNFIKRVQRRFTKSIPELHNLTDE